VNDEEDVNWIWENIEENIQTSEESLGLHELKQNKPWFDEECLGFLDQMKRAKMQWIQDPSQSNVDILNNVRRALKVNSICEGNYRGSSVWLSTQQVDY